MTAWDKGPAGLLGPEDGRSYWPPRPTSGWVTVKFSPATFAHDAAACGVHVIAPGGRLPLQAHRAAEKVWYVLEGAGTATVDGNKGSVLSLPEQATAHNRDAAMPPPV